MKRTLTVVLTVFFLAATPAISAAGRGHHHYHGHRGHYGGHYGGYYGDVWAAVGIGLLTGVILSAIFVPPPPRRTVVYPSAAPVAVPAYTNPGAVSTSATVTVTVGALNLRSGPGLTRAVIGRLRQGEILTVLGGSPGWLNVRTPAGGVGWVMSRYTAGAVG